MSSALGCETLRVLHVQIQEAAAEILASTKSDTDTAV